jgi:quercetin dioxygenase-like cupin family protein
MKLIRPSDVPPVDAAAPIFIGEVTRQTLVDGEMSPDFNLGLINFNHGARNKFHRHTNDQVLVVTAGNGIVATEDESVEVQEGDVIHVPAGEKHWHGARDGHDFSHISITVNGSSTEILE